MRARRQTTTGHMVGVILALAAAISACTGGGDDPTPSPGTPVDSPVPTTLGRPGDVRADTRGWNGDPKSWEVRLRWRAPEGEVDGYRVLRDGREIGTTREASFTDRDVTPATPYSYGVIAVGADEVESAEARSRVRTRSLPTADARLEGRFAIRLKAASSSVGANNAAMLFMFDPACSSGPCPTRMTVRRRTASGTLSVSGDRYSGTASGTFLILDCRGGSVTESLDVALEITRAAPIRDAWRATRISGSIDEDAPAVSGCLSGSTDWSFTGVVQS